MSRKKISISLVTILVSFVVMGLFTIPLSAQGSSSRDPRPAVNPAPPTDAQTTAPPATNSASSVNAVAIQDVRAAVADVSEENIRRIVEKLVSFGTRSTLSAADSETIAKGQGVGAAREWIRSEFEKISKECGGCLEVKTDEFMDGPAPRIPVPTKLVNVYAVMRGTDEENAKRIYLVTGHYDSRNSSNENITDPAPGANDDASGTAVSLESARLLSKKKFPATIIFLTVVGEEQGLNGSKHFAKMAKDAGWNLQAVLNNDIVGGDLSGGQNPNVVRVFSEGIPFPDVPPAQPTTPPAASATGENTAPRAGGNNANALNSAPRTGCAIPPAAPLAVTSGAASTAVPSVPPTDTELRRMAADLRAIRSAGYENDSASRQVARYMTDVAHNLNMNFEPMMVFRQDRYLRGGDHTSFNEFGFAAVRITEYRENYDHQHQTPRMEGGTECGDLIKFVDFHYVANVAKLNAATLASLATAPAPPRRVRMNTRRLDNDTEMLWEASPGGLAAEYEIVWRYTYEPNWSHVEKAGNALKLLMPISKDNVFFGVRAVGKDGSKSLVVVPGSDRGGTPVSPSN